MRESARREEGWLAVQFGARLRSLRRSADLTQAALAERIDVTTEHVSLLERGRVAPSFRTLERLVDALGTSVGEFFRFPDTASPHARPGRPSRSELGRG